MKILLDEMLRSASASCCQGHDVSTATYTGFAGLPNGELIGRAVAAGFDVIVSLDRGVRQQQNLARTSPPSWENWSRPQPTRGV